MQREMRSVTDMLSVSRVRSEASSDATTSVRPDMSNVALLAACGPMFASARSLTCTGKWRNFQSAAQAHSKLRHISCSRTAQDLLAQLERLGRVQGYTLSADHPDIP